MPTAAVSVLIFCFTTSVHGFHNQLSSYGYERTGSDGYYPKDRSENVTSEEIVFVIGSPDDTAAARAGKLLFSLSARMKGLLFHC